MNPTPIPFRHEPQTPARRRALRILTALAGSGLLAACAGPEVRDYAAERPLLDLRQYFNGTVDAWGVFTDRSGKVVKRFTVVMDCRWEGEHGVLDESFRYSDGSTQRRVWRLVRHADGRYTGSADDVVGSAEGEARGNAFNLALHAGVAGRRAGLGGAVR